MADAFKVEYSHDMNEVCIIPMPFISCEHFGRILELYSDLGYKYWLPADERCGYILSKKTNVPLSCTL